MALTRYHQDWITAFLEYTSYGEAPRRMYFWTAISTIAGALRRKVWIDQISFQLYPNFYICLVAPPGVVSKTTTAEQGMRLLKQVPEVSFGPDIVTWPALVQAFSEAKIEFLHDGLYYPMSAMTLSSGEFGNLLDPQDKQMVDLLVSLWDGKQGTFDKKTKHSGSDSVENPWINLIACTTPAWIAGNFPEYMVGGGFASRMIFVYADKKAQLVAYPSRHIPKGVELRRERLINDLTRISEMTGPMTISEEAMDWGEVWYARQAEVRPLSLDNERFAAYVARKQTHMHKLAMILSASESNSMLITCDHMQTADNMLADLEPDLEFVFNKIGKTSISVYTEKVVQFVHSHGVCSYAEAYRAVHSHFPSMREFEDVMAGCIRAGYVKMENGTQTLRAGVPLPSASNGQESSVVVVAE